MAALSEFRPHTQGVDGPPPQASPQKAGIVVFRETPPNQVLDPEFNNWRQFAACRDMDVNIFFPRRGTPKEQQAVHICQGCHVLEQCRTQALTQPQVYGVQGGMTEGERLQLREATIPYERLTVEEHQLIQRKRRNERKKAELEQQTTVEGPLPGVNVETYDILQHAIQDGRFAGLDPFDQEITYEYFFTPASLGDLARLTGRNKVVLSQFIRRTVRSVWTTSPTEMKEQYDEEKVVSMKAPNRARIPKARKVA